MSDREANSRRGFLGVAAAGLAGVMLAPGIRLIEIAQAQAPQAGAMSSSPLNSASSASMVGNRSAGSLASPRTTSAASARVAGARPSGGSGRGWPGGVPSRAPRKK